MTSDKWITIIVLAVAIIVWCYKYIQFTSGE